MGSIPVIAWMKGTETIKWQIRLRPTIDLVTTIYLMNLATILVEIVSVTLQVLMVVAKRS